MPPEIRDPIADLMRSVPDKGGQAVDREGEGMKDSARYAKVVEWSEEDGCYLGSAPGLILGGCHGDDERQVFDELCQIVEEAIDLYRQDGKPLPPPTSGRELGSHLAGAG
jgi:predicted RNase H-like HicB family nuclease